MEKYRWTDGHDEANCHFTQLVYEHNQKKCFVYEEGLCKTVAKVVHRALKEQVFTRCSIETDFEINALTLGVLNISCGFPPNLKSLI